MNNSFENILTSEEQIALRKELDALIEGDQEALKQLVLDAKILVSPYLNDVHEIQPLVKPENLEEGIKVHRHKLGSTPLPNEHRLHKHGTFDYRWEVRTVKATVYVKFTHPQLSNMLDHAITCCAAAGIAGVIAAVGLGGNVAAGYAIFYPSWKLCMAGKVGADAASNISVSLEFETVKSNWENH